MEYANRIRQRKVRSCITEQAHQLMLQIFGGVHDCRVTVLEKYLVMYIIETDIDPHSHSHTLT